MAAREAHDVQVGWQGLFGLARSIAMYRLIPGRGRRIAKLYGPIVRPGDLCFDIGAHIGNRARALARLGARVVAVEPQPLFAAYLRRTLPRHGNIILLDVAIGETEGETVLNISRRTPTVSTTNATWMKDVGTSEGFARVSWDDRLSVEQTTLDALIARHGVPRLCKIDVEGGEAAVLAGLSQPIEHVSFEYIPAAIDVALKGIDRLAALGTYRYRATIGEGVKPVDSDEWTPEQARAWLVSRPSQSRFGDLHARLVADDG